MLRFSVTREGRAVQEVDLGGAYMVGSDGVPLRAELEFRDATILCAKRADGPAALALLWDVPECGAMMLETSRLMDREQPYILPLELARGRLTRINLKREDWGLFDFEGVEPVAGEIDQARDLLVEALKAETPADQGKMADAALRQAILAGERLSQFHADIFLARRKQIHAFTRRTLGCTVAIENTTDGYRQRLREGFDFAYLPVPWRAIEPKQGEFNWRPFDAWVEWLAKHRMPMRLGPLVSFHENHVPPWVSMYETDFETVRNLIFEHVRRLVERYGNYVYQWQVICGVHAENTFDFTFEQLMEVTRVTVALVKQLAPRSQTLIDLVAPWGEYYARNQRTIPPLLYADMVVQSGVGFDGLGVQLLFGRPADGMYVRDMFQISEKLDRLGNLGKSVHVTAVQVPSQQGANGAVGGCWRKSWDEAVQAQWVKEFYTIALSKPFVESVAWLDLADIGGPEGLEGGGLLRSDLAPKPAYKVVKDFRAELLSATRKPPATRPSAQA